jgi:DNA-binding NtrC family response regulator
VCVRQNRILVVEADPVIRSGICNFLVAQGFVVAEAADGGEASTELRRFCPDALVLDANFPDIDVTQLMLKAQSAEPKLPVLLLSGQIGPDLRPHAIPFGADAVLGKPVDPAELHATVSRLLRTPRPAGTRDSALQLASEVLDPFLGSSPAIRRLREIAGRVAASYSPVLIQGETGTGKGVLAKWIHHQGPRARRSFLDLNCAGLSRELLESELFGHQKGAFTSATSAKQGLLEVANGGTVFLDEIGDMDLQVQSKLLKVLEERVFRRLGDVRDRAVDIRLISATHRELQQLVREQRFRGDLYFRVNIVWLKIPPLRQRVEDIVPLAEYLLHSIGRQWGREQIGISAGARRALESYAWPGNIRELRNVLERALLLAEFDALDVEHLQFQPSAAASSFVLQPNGTLKQMERAYIRHVLEAERGSVERAARKLGIPRSSLYNKMRRLAIPQGTGRANCELGASAAD